ncbi:hypothetical protein [Neptuniibacter sp. QD37_11]|uniref:hypothetical protein n=1 Tax=Neptuniibacter sp. QD37_11 TaxID=3398209 RepID=UPI0039F4FB30
MYQLRDRIALNLIKSMAKDQKKWIFCLSMCAIPLAFLLTYYCQLDFKNELQHMMISVVAIFLATFIGYAVLCKFLSPVKEGDKEMSDIEASGILIAGTIISGLLFVGLLLLVELTGNSKIESQIRWNIEQYSATHPNHPVSDKLIKIWKYGTHRDYIRYSSSFEHGEYEIEPIGARFQSALLEFAYRLRAPSPTLYQAMKDKVITSYELHTFLNNEPNHPIVPWVYNELHTPCPKYYHDTNIELKKQCNFYNRDNKVMFDKIPNLVVY